MERTGSGWGPGSRVLEFAPPVLDKTSGGIAVIGGEAISVQGDVADFEAMQTMANTVHDTFNAVDVLVNNAGITSDHSFESMTPAEWESVVEVNIAGVFNATKAFYDNITEAEGPHNQHLQHHRRRG